MVNKVTANMKLFLSTALLFICLESDAQFKFLDLADSSVVKRFIVTHSICDQILAVEMHKKEIIKENKKGYLILKNISKLTGCTFFIPLVTGRVFFLPAESRLQALQEQLEEVRREVNCPDVGRKDSSYVR